MAAAIASGALAKDPMTESLRGLGGEKFDQAFLSQMIDHHKQGVEMAQLASKRAQKSEVKQFAQKTAQSQQKDIEEMKGMQGGKKGSHHAATSGTSHVDQSSHSGGTSHEGAGAATGRSSHESSASSHHMSGTAHQQHEQMKKETMSKLENAKGAEFDRVFVEEMTKHHQMGKEMAQLAQQQGSRTEVKEFAKKIVNEQTKELDELNNLKRMASR